MAKVHTYIMQSDTANWHEELSAHDREVTTAWVCIRQQINKLIAYIREQNCKRIIRTGIQTGSESVCCTQTFYPRSKA